MFVLLHLWTAQYHVVAEALKTMSIRLANDDCFERTFQKVTTNQTIATTNGWRNGTTADGIELPPPHKMPPTELRDESERLKDSSLDGDTRALKRSMWGTSWWSSSTYSDLQNSTNDTYDLVYQSMWGGEGGFNSIWDYFTKYKGTVMQLETSLFGMTAVRAAMGEFSAITQRYTNNCATDNGGGVSGRQHSMFLAQTDLWSHMNLHSSYRYWILQRTCVYGPPKQGGK